jgi:type IV secretory pathway VirB10-like protein
MEKSVKAFIDIKGIDAVKAPPPPPKEDETKPTKRTETPEEVAARIAEEARIIKENEEKRAKEREEKKKEMLVPDPLAVALIERLEKQRIKFQNRTMLKREKEQQKAEEEAQKEQLRLAKLMESTADPIVKPTNAQIAHDLEVCARLLIVKIYRVSLIAYIIFF